MYDIEYLENNKQRSEIALKLTYARDFKGFEIAQNAIVEIEKTRSMDEETKKAWENVLGRMIPDVHANDTLVGVLKPGKGLFIYGGKEGILMGHCEDPELGIAFMNIWLDERTSHGNVLRNQKPLGLSDYLNVTEQQHGKPSLMY